LRPDPLLPERDQKGRAFALQDGVEFGCGGVIQAHKLEPRIMRYELTDFEWTAIKPFLPKGARAPWRDLRKNFGPYTTCYNRFVRWGRAGVWDKIMDALAAMHDAAVQMIDTSVIRVHQHGACIARDGEQQMGRL
jgi:transposase